jgi:alkanesulfonate monooxygenase SsuD/methylene tetrahydromethanopterin reductase-like flavin-dependent oxidoreductase (luciferase family)
LNVFDDIQFYVLNHHHYADVPPDEDEFATTFVTYSNHQFDPEIGAELYQRWNREVLLAEELGFDGVAVNEHHQTVFSMMPAASVRAAYIAAMTKRVKILCAGIPINLSWPSRVAEEYAMLDLMSGGRMEYGIPLGTGMEYWANAGQINPTTARARFREALEVILQTWTEKGPTRYDGDFYSYRHLNVWPRPLQQPHRSSTSSARAARRRSRWPPTTARATRSCSRRSSSSSRRWRATASWRPSAAGPSSPTTRSSA